MTQDTALEILKTGANVFLTGEPGSGKTHTINEYIKYLRLRDVEPAITASTGIAATHVGGFTIHSFAGIGVKKHLSDYDLEDLTQREALVKRIRNVQVLIIEEISMLDARVLDMADRIFRTIRSQNEPFGGVQVVFVGDFFQLPPVAKGEATTFAFDAHVWREAKPVTCYLHEQYRQEDEMFLGILSRIRRASVTYDDRRTISGCKVDGGGTDVSVTKLFSHNADVDRINDQQLAQLSERVHIFTMSSRGAKGTVEGLKRGCLSPEILSLKEGAVVMCTKNNFDRGYVNGTLGTVRDFDAGGWPVIETHAGETITMEPEDWNLEDNGKIRATITQIPLRLAWAITVHKSQGMSLDAAHIDLGRAFEYGQGYVALSRVRSLAGLHIAGVNDRAFEVHPDVLSRDTWFRNHSDVAESKFAALEPADVRDMHTRFLDALGARHEPRSDAEQKMHEAEKNTRKKKGSTYEITRVMLADGKSVSDIARTRGITLGTVLGHCEKLKDRGDIAREDIKNMWNETGLSDNDLLLIHKTFTDLGTRSLSPVHKKHKEQYSYEELRTARLLLE